METSIPEVDLHNEYEMLNESLGQGAYGRVFLVQSKKTKQKYAVKEHLKPFDKEDKKQDFRKEVLSYSKVTSPAILTMHAYSLTNFTGCSFPIIITEYMPNKSLGYYYKPDLDPSLRLTQKQKYIILLGTAIGMKTIHAHGIIHRDLKPDNILLDIHFYPHICDFGMSYISDLTASQIIMSTIVGSPLYQAPEILDDIPYNHKIDVYSFSLVAYQLFTDKIPFARYKNIFKLANMVIEGGRPDLSDFHNEDIKLFLETLWSRAPEKRPTFDSVVEELLDEKYQKFFGISDEEVDRYLDIFDDSMKLSSSGSKLLANFRRKAMSGDEDAMFRLAVIYDQGEYGIEVNKEKAAEYFRLACEKGHAEAMLLYGRKLRLGDGVEVDKQKASEIYKEFADEGNLKAMNNYGTMRLLGDGIEVNKEIAAHYLKMAADQHHPGAALKYANMLYAGDGIPENKDLAARYYKISADGGNESALIKYADMCITGDGIDEDKEEAAKAFEKLANRGNSEAAIRFGVMLLVGNGIKQDKRKAAKMMKLAADEGNVDAICNYGIMLYRGDGGISYKEKGAQLVQEAASKGSQKAKDFIENEIGNDKQEVTSPRSAQHTPKWLRRSIRIISPDSDMINPKVSPMRASTYDARRLTISDSDSDDNSDDIYLPTASPNLSTFSIAVKRIVNRILDDVAKSCHMKNNFIWSNPDKDKEYQEGADIIWYDGYMTIDKYKKYLPSRHVNKVPGLNGLCKNRYFFDEMNKMKTKFPLIYQEIFPPTYILPQDNEKFEANDKKNTSQAIPYIQKLGGQSKGMLLVTDPSGFNISEECSIVQQFTQPFLVDGRKFVIRAYVMITDLDPLKVFIYNECFAYFCQEPFTSPTQENLSSYVFDMKAQPAPDFEPIRPGKATLEKVAGNGKHLWKQIQRISALAVLSIYKPMLNAAVQSCEKNDAYFDGIIGIPPSHRFFHLLGIDFAINSKGKPLVIGMNDNPGMREISKFDYKAKFQLVKSQYEMVCSVIKNKNDRVENWTQILPSRNHSVKSVADVVMKSTLKK
ncbi:positive regulation of cilium movement [Tritrichomonas musculus]|uniref:Positive regulation of cilium movement n=1 Tax=Tritrichomonas musculus TaxID=1915356 RepID=A0ABR2GST7_9EUKA